MKVSKCWKEGCNLGQPSRDAWGGFVGEGFTLSSLLLLRSPGLAGRIKPGLQCGAVLVGCASGQNELKWGALDFSMDPSGPWRNPGLLMWCVM